MEFVEKILEESERTKAAGQAITKHIAICAFISNNASWERESKSPTNVTANEFAALV
jgi:hypothetical protein